MALWQFEECSGGVLPSEFVELHPNEQALIAALFLHRMGVDKLKNMYPAKEL